MATHLRTRPPTTSSAAGSCAVCGAPRLRDIIVRRDARSLLRCAACGSWTLLPRLGDEAQAALHDSEEYHTHAYFRSRRGAAAALRRRVRQAFARIAEAAPPESLRGERVLDVGCDTGEFLLCAAGEFGVVPVGLDVSSRAIEEAARRGVEAYHADLRDAPASLGNFTLITAIDVIEHTAEPGEFLAQVCARLRPGGAAYLETPNPASLVYGCGRVLDRMTGGRPRGVLDRLFPPQHAQYFARRALADLARGCGLDVVRIGSRILPPRDIAAPPAVRWGLAPLQTVDAMTGRGHLLCAVLRRPR